jgi:hypothetical protein
MPAILVRKLNSAGDPMRGAGLSNFATDIEAVAQILSTRLRLLQAEWFENLLEGTPLFQSLLGHPITSQGVAFILRRRILGTPYVTGIQALQVNYGRAGRTFAFIAVVQTAFGPVAISNTQQPGGSDGQTWSSSTGTWDSTIETWDSV